MEFDHDIDLSQRKFTSRLIVERALARGWKVTGFKSNPAIFLITIPGREKPIKVFSASPPQMSYPASKVAKDKFITNNMLRLSDLPVPDEMLIDLSKPLAEIKIKSFLAKHNSVVVKPIDASHGKGITVNISDYAALKKAIQEAKDHTERSIILLQEQVSGVDIRIVCIDYKFVDSISRIPAHVIGDGILTVKELIKQTNNKPDRGENYKAKLNFIPLNKAEEYLGAKRFNAVPARDEYVQVIGVSNVGMGGERHNIKHDIPEFLKILAERSAKELELPVCGVDFMVKRLPHKNDSLDDLSPAIIEVNECPMLTMYDDLQSSDQNAVIDQYLDFLAKS